MSYDVVIIGAGPAGMSAALEASTLGLRASVLDEQSAPGGQRFRAVERMEQRLRAVGTALPASEVPGLELVRRFRETGSPFLDQASVWDISADGREVSYLRNGTSFTIRAKAIVVATGAYERPVPVQGWDLPGVLGGGAAQTMLKISGRKVQGRIVLLGCGPLLLLTAHQLANAGANIVGLLQTTTPIDFLRAIPHLSAALSSPALLKRGIQLFMRMPPIPKAYSISRAKIVGDDRVLGVEYQDRGVSRFVGCDTVLLHFGVIPNTQITRLAGVAHGWNEKQEYWYPIVDKWQETSIENFMVAGDGGGILGDEAAILTGRLSVHRIAHRMGQISDQSLAKLAEPLQRGLARLAAGRAFLDAMFRVPQSMLIPSPETIICRCEEITAADIKSAIARGVSGFRQLKVHTRIGMGRCRAQMCSMAIMTMMTPGMRSGEGPPPPATVRPPIRPLTLGQLADAILPN